MVSLWAGAAPRGERAEDAASRDHHEPIWDRLCSGLEEVLRYGDRAQVQIAFEPEPGMFIERPVGYAELCRRLGPSATSAAAAEQASIW